MGIWNLANEAGTKAALNLSVIVSNHLNYTNTNMKRLFGWRLYSVFLCVTVAFFGGAMSQSALAKAFVLPHVLEKSGSISGSQFTFDTAIVLTYNASLSGT